MKPVTRQVVWIVFAGAVLLVMGLKAWQSGWLQPQASLELDGQPAVLAFIKRRGVCECEQIVIDNARAQLEAWSEADRYGLPLHHIEIDVRSGLARQYEVIRVPSMLLLDAAGEIIWRQDGVTRATSDAMPLDLDAVKANITALLDAEKTEGP
jgi:hypothetical protein